MALSWITKLETAIARKLLKLPGKLLVLLSGRTGVVRDGETLHPQIQFMMGARAMSGKPMRLQNGDVANSRQRMVAECTQFTANQWPDVATRDLGIDAPAGPVPARLYSPTSATAESPLMLFFHGGGFILGSIESHDGACRVMAEGVGMHVLSVDYRLAPEAPFPAALEDAMAAYRYVLDCQASLGLVPSKLFIAGDSAGGNIATVACYMAREEGLRQPDLQLLIYPVTDLHNRSKSRLAFDRGLFLEGPAMDWFAELYTNGAAALTLDPRCSPLLIEDLSTLAPAHVVTAALDPLRDEGEAFAERLQAAGVPTTHHREPQLIHGFINMVGALPIAHEAMARIVGRLRESAAS